MVSCYFTVSIIWHGTWVAGSGRHLFIRIWWRKFEKVHTVHNNSFVMVGGDIFRLKSLTSDLEPERWFLSSAEFLCDHNYICTKHCPWCWQTAESTMCPSPQLLQTSMVWVSLPWPLTMRHWVACLVSLCPLHSSVSGLFRFSPSLMGGNCILREEQIAFDSSLSGTFFGQREPKA